METIIIGAFYLFCGLVASVFLIMFLISANIGLVLTFDFLLYLTYKVITVVPCLLIAYAFFRRKRWGLYLLVIYNSLWIFYVSYAVFAEIMTTGPGMRAPVLIAVLLIYFVLISLVVSAVRLKGLN